MDINKPVGALTVQELLDILQPVISNQNPIQPERTENVKHLVYGLKGLAELLHCSIATANRIDPTGYDFLDLAAFPFYTFCLNPEIPFAAFFL